MPLVNFTVQTVLHGHLFFNNHRFDKKTLWKTLFFRYLLLKDKNNGKIIAQL